MQEDAEETTRNNHPVDALRRESNAFLSDKITRGIIPQVIVRRERFAVDSCDNLLPYIVIDELDSSPHHDYGIIFMYSYLEIVTQQEPPAVSTPWRITTNV